MQVTCRLWVCQMTFILSRSRRGIPMVSVAFIRHSRSSPMRRSVSSAPRVCRRQCRAISSETLRIFCTPHEYAGRQPLEEQRIQRVAL
ncbi:hypothetical protein DPEC_G00368090 [Dallia pectoralis]|nr:hypothetical protein DPEC_G00368090 [Dallia pectoralis]